MNNNVNALIQFLGQQAEIALAAYKVAVANGCSRKVARDTALVVLKAFLETSEEKQEGKNREKRDL